MARILIDNWPKQIRSLISKKLNTFTISSSGKSSRRKVAISDKVEHLITFSRVAKIDVMQYQSPKSRKANVFEKLITGYHKYFWQLKNGSFFYLIKSQLQNYIWEGASFTTKAMLTVF